MFDYKTARDDLQKMKVFDTAPVFALLQQLEEKKFPAPALSSTEEAVCLEWTDNETVRRHAQVYVTFWLDFVFITSPGLQYRYSFPNVFETEPILKELQYVLSHKIE